MSCNFHEKVLYLKKKNSDQFFFVSLNSNKNSDSVGAGGAVPHPNESHRFDEKAQTMQAVYNSFFIEKKIV